MEAARAERKVPFIPCIRLIPLVGHHLFGNAGI
jgi:hypothetical protein